MVETVETPRTKIDPIRAFSHFDSQSYITQQQNYCLVSAMFRTGPITDIAIVF